MSWLHLASVVDGKIASRDRSETADNDHLEEVLDEDGELTMIDD